jgi:predicted nucleotidyltransferase
MTTSASGQSTALLAELVALFDERATAYAVIGAMAVAVHGAIRASQDADALVKVSVAELRDLKSFLELRDYATQLRVGDHDDPIGAVLEVSDRYGNRVDLLAGLRGLDGDAFTRVIRVHYENATLKVIGLEDLIAMKAHAGGPLDLQDARRILEANHGALDAELVMQLARKFGADAQRNCEQLLATGAD